MRAFAISALLASFAFLAGCQTVQIDQTVAQVISTTKAICKFVPTAASVAKILTASTFVDTATGVAGAICNAVTTAPLADGPGDRKPRVNGVVVEGKFVK